MIHFTFETTEFADPGNILAQNINRIEGNALAVWLARELKSRSFDTSDVWAEDHGWDFSVKQGDATYLISCSLAGDEDDEIRNDGREGAVREGHVVLHKSRSMMDKLMGHNKLEKDDALAAALRTALVGRGGIIHFAES